MQKKMSQQVIFSGSTKEDFLSDLRNIVREEISSFTPATQSQKKYLTLPEASEYLGLSRSAIYRMTSEKQIPFIKKGRLFFDTAELSKWLQESAQKIQVR